MDEHRRRISVRRGPRGRQPGAGRGSVVLVGCGPGAPDLLTLRACRVIAGAEALVYDRLVSPAIVALGPQHAQRIYVGKARSRHTVPQEEINALLVRLARQGKRVVRLKGGDPFIFGRGGEEVEVLARHAIPFEIVPGVTAASGAAACAGIPLTHRDHAHSLTFVTGHLVDDNMELDWAGLARPGQTVVFYMGLTGLHAICAKLVAHGLAVTTPAAIVQHATLPTQRVLTATLADLAARAKAAALEPPTLIVIGEVVGLQPEFAWLPKVDASAATRV
jgi:uroporphyrin-III C-methyltransferase/precorrin-2 dehydrogenase/sirohydrochlorin ferrochelatase